MSGLTPPPAPRPRPRLRIQYPPELPIEKRAADIAAAIAKHQVVIVAGATGSGKTTQLPKIAIESGRGTEKRIGVTQPRRIAATSVAARVASELECTLGAGVGYQIRFEDRTSAATAVKFMTDGILLAEITGDRLLRQYDTLIVDEAHERSLTIDFVLGWLRRILPERPDLKVIVSSATLETARFSEFFGGAPVLEVEGRTFPVDVLYEPPDTELDLADAVANAVESVTALDARGDVLVFLPGEREIREAEQELGRRSLRHTQIQPLYARLPAAEQSKVFASISGRRVILATNVAETSLTLPGIVYVIDTGLARLARYDPRTGTTRLQIEGISQASADQRKGRCGRVREGICVRLYDEASFSARPAFTDPEIKRVGLAGVILRMKSYGLGDVEEFPFLDAPHPRSISEGYRVLEELGALDEARDLTELGRKLAHFPVDPRIGRMILAGAERGCLQEILVLAAALNIQDPRERPRGAEPKADAAHQRFRDERSDFVGLLRLWAFVREAQGAGTSNLRRVCRANFLSFLRIREWMEVHRELGQIVRDLRLDRPPRRHGPRRDAPEPTPGQKANDPHAALHQALLSGLLSRVGRYDAERRNYAGARQTRFAIHPSSALAKKPPAWVMAFELVETSQLFARTVAKIEPEWLEQVGDHLLKRSYSDPHWSEKSGRASVREHATLFGLQVLRDRSVDYATLSPVRARLMFLEHALVRGEYASRGAFQAHNRDIVAEAARLRDKARRSEMLADDEGLIAFFDSRVPDSVVNGKTFELWREAAERRDPRLLCLSIEHVLNADEALVPEHYPDSLTLHGVECALHYRFDPSAEDDGITLTLPLALLPQLVPGELDWTIPAWHAQKISALLHELPKPLQKDLGSLPALADLAAKELVPFRGPMLPALARVLFEATGVEVRADAFRPDALPGYLRFTFEVTGERGQPLGRGRDLALLSQQLGARVHAALEGARGSSAWERTGITRWDFGDLPEFVTRPLLGANVRAYPGVVDRQSSVELALFANAEASEVASRAGIRRLLMLGARAHFSALAKRVPAPLLLRRGSPPSRAASDEFRDQVLQRVADVAFDLAATAKQTRSQSAFERLLASGTPRVDASFSALVGAISAIAAELERTQRALESAGKQPSGTAAANEIRAQLEQLLPTDWIAHTDLAHLVHFPRYLRAAQTRLSRAVVDPRKDAAKLAPLAPLWQTFLAKRSRAHEKDSARTLHIAFEELRVAIFAPELKPALPVTIASVTAALESLR
jgi:ATP-dependent helicase HrpA